ncbi:MAG: DUF2029 domain-containing protein [Anaerolineae bacterium]|nr:DUF2029 domain-containing protein [Anaerolineae bacterium]
MNLHAVWNAVQGQWRARRRFWLLLIAFTSLRGFSIVLLRPGGFVIDTGPDHQFYFEFARWAGGQKWAFFDFWMEYPPLMLWLAGLAYRLSLYIPAWSVDIFAFNLVFRSLLLPFEVGTLILIYKVGQIFQSVETEQIGKSVSQAEWTAIVWALLFAPFFTFLAWFDAMVIFFLVLAIYALLTDHPILAGIAIGLGFATKIIPVVLAPMGLFVLTSWRQRIVYVLSAVVVVLLIFLPPLIVSPDYTLAMVRVFLSRSSWESVWALLEGYVGYGAVATLETHLDPATADYQIHPATLPWSWISLAFLTFYIFILTRRINWRDKRVVTAFSCFSLMLFILYSKGYSPQWASYITTLVLLCLPLGRAVGYGVLLDGFVVAELTLGFQLLGGDSHFITGIILLRTCVFVALLLESLALLWPAGHSVVFWRIVRCWSLPVVLVVMLVGTGMLTVPAWRTYRERRLNADPLFPFVQAWRVSGENLPVVVMQSGLQERLSPHLGPQNVQLFAHLRGIPFEDVPMWLARLAEEERGLWLIYDTDHDSPPVLYDGFLNWLEENACLGSQTRYHTLVGAQYYLPYATAATLDVRFAQPVRLVSVQGIPSGRSREERQTSKKDQTTGDSSYCLRITWMADEMLSVDYAVFVHLIGTDGQVVANADAWPQVPTTAWTVGAESFSAHVLHIPATLAPGAYTLSAGLYSIADGTRVLLPSGQDAIPLTVIQIGQ